jgi:hypothetical protein
LRHIEDLSDGFKLFKERGLTSDSNLFCLTKHEPSKDGKVRIVHRSWHASQQLAHSTHFIVTRVKANAPNN